MFFSVCLCLQFTMTALCPAIMNISAAMDPPAPAAAPLASFAQLAFLLLLMRCFWIGSVMTAGMIQPAPAVLLAVQMLTVAATTGSAGASCSSHFMQHPLTAGRLDALYGWLEPGLFLTQPLVMMMAAGRRAEGAAWRCMSGGTHCFQASACACCVIGVGGGGVGWLWSLHCISPPATHPPSPSLPLLCLLAPLPLPAVHVGLIAWGALLATAAIFFMQLRDYRRLKQKQQQCRQAAGISRPAPLEPGKCDACRPGGAVSPLQLNAPQAGPLGGPAQAPDEPAACLHSLLFCLQGNGSWLFLPAWLHLCGRGWTASGWAWHCPVPYSYGSCAQ